MQGTPVNHTWTKFSPGSRHPISSFPQFNLVLTNSILFLATSLQPTLQLLLSDDKGERMSLYKHSNYAHLSETSCSLVTLRTLHLPMVLLDIGTVACRAT